MEIVDHSRVTNALGKGPSECTVTNRSLLLVLIDTLLGLIGPTIKCTRSVEHD